MTATIRFGLPSPDDPEQVVLGCKWGGALPRANEYLHHFPVGVYMAGTAHNTTVPTSGTWGGTFANNSATAVRNALFHPVVGVLANNLRYFFWSNNHPANHEGIQHFTDIVESARPRVYQVPGPMQSTNWNQGWDDWFIDTNGNATLSPTYQPGVHTTELANTLAESVVSYYDDKWSVLGYNIRDDVANGDEKRLTNLAITAMQTFDPRPAMAMWGNHEGGEDTADVKVMTRYVYPCGRHLNDTETAEGDFHRSTFGGGDYEDVITTWMEEVDPELPRWLILQAHRTFSGGGGSQLRLPTPLEMRKMFWMAIGVGVRGIFWNRWSSVDGESVGLADASAAGRLAVANELAVRLSPGIRERLLYARHVPKVFSTSGGGRADIPQPYASAYAGTLYDETHDIYYCVLANHSLSTEDVTVDSETLTGSLRNLETGVETPLGSAISLPALDGGVFMHVPDSLYRTMVTASDDAVEGCRFFRENGEAYTTVPGNGAWRYDVGDDAVDIYSGTVVDDHDANYGEAHKLHGLCLKYLRTKDASIIPDIEAQVQWHIGIEQALVADKGAYWAGAAPYFYWTSATPSGVFPAESYGDPSINGGAGEARSYTQGEVRSNTSVDQAHMVAHGLYSYRYLLRNEAAITSRQTWTDALDLISRMATWEVNQTTYSNAASTKICGNLLRICQGLTPTLANADTNTTPYFGDIFTPWQVNNAASTNISPSSNSTIDLFFRNLFASNGTLAATQRFLRGRAMDMLASDMGYHDIEWDPAFDASKPVGPYPKGWMPRAQVGSTLRYATPRTIASNNGYASDLHYQYVANSSARDGLSGRGPQRMVVLCLLALIDPTYEVPVELAPDGSTVLRSVPIVEACNNCAETMAAHIVEPTTKCVRHTAPLYLGSTNSHEADAVDSAFTGYWMMAIELWHLVHSGADYTDYYPIGLW